jgi:hypothetical protein
VLVTLRPLFCGSARGGSPALHELFHISIGFDGTLDSSRRHASMGKRFGRSFVTRTALWLVPSRLLAPSPTTVKWWRGSSGLAWLPGEKPARAGLCRKPFVHRVVRMKTHRAKAVRHTHEKSGALH